jgi:invasion protein IalB
MPFRWRTSVFDSGNAIQVTPRAAEKAGFGFALKGRGFRRAVDAAQSMRL